MALRLTEGPNSWNTTNFEYEGEKIYARNPYMDEKKSKPRDENESAQNAGTLAQQIENARNRVWTTNPDFDYYVNLASLKEKYNRTSVSQVSIDNEKSLPAWSIQGIRDMTAWNIIDLESGNIFSGSKVTTKGEMTAFITRLCGLKSKGTTLGFTDVSSSYRYRGELISAYENGLIDIPGTKKFGPDTAMTRESAALLIYKALSKMFGAEKVKSAATGKLTYKDVAKLSASSKTAIQTLERCGLYSGIVNGQFQASTSVSMAETAAVLDKMVGKFINK